MLACSIWLYIPIYRQVCTYSMLAIVIGTSISISSFSNMLWLTALKKFVNVRIVIHQFFLYFYWRYLYFNWFFFHPRCSFNNLWLLLLLGIFELFFLISRTNQFSVVTKTFLFCNFYKLSCGKTFTESVTPNQPHL